MLSATILCSIQRIVAASNKNVKTVCMREMYDHDSLLLYLTPAEICGKVCELNGESCEQNREAKALQENQWTALPIEHMVLVTLSEPNVLVLDMAEYAFDNGEWMPREEHLRIDNKFRSILGYPLRMNAYAQPWYGPDTWRTTDREWAYEY